MKSSVLSVLLLLFSELSLFSLSEEERQALPEMSKEELIKIILIYDETLNQIDSENQKNEQLLNERKSLIDQRETDLNERESLIVNRENRADEREASFQAREQLLAESLRLQRENAKAKFWNGFAIGSCVGFTIGGFSGYGVRAVSDQFK